MSSFSGLSTYNKTHLDLLKSYSHDYWLEDVNDKIKDDIDIINNPAVFNKHNLTIEARTRLEIALNYISQDYICMLLEKERDFLDEEAFEAEYGIKEPNEIFN